MRPIPKTKSKDKKAGTTVIMVKPAFKVDCVAQIHIVKAMKVKVNAPVISAGNITLSMSL